MIRMLFAMFVTLAGFAAAALWMARGGDAREVVEEIFPDEVRSAVRSEVRSAVERFDLENVASHPGFPASAPKRWTRLPARIRRKMRRGRRRAEAAEPQQAVVAEEAVEERDLSPRTEFARDLGAAADDGSGDEDGEGDGDRRRRERPDLGRGRGPAAGARPGRVGVPHPPYARGVPTDPSGRVSAASRVFRLACHAAVIAWGAAFFAASILEAPVSADAAEAVARIRPLPEKLREEPPPAEVAQEQPAAEPEPPAEPEPAPPAASTQSRGRRHLPGRSAPGRRRRLPGVELQLRVVPLLPRLRARHVVPRRALRRRAPAADRREHRPRDGRDRRRRSRGRVLAARPGLHG